MILETSGELLVDIAKSAEALGRDDILLEFKEDRFITMIKGVENTSMFAARVPEGGLREYDSRGETELALPANKIIDFNPGKKEYVRLEYDDHKFSLSDGDYTANFNAVNTDYIEGAMDETIKTDWPIDVTGEMDQIRDFMSTAKSVVGEETFIVGARVDGLYLMSKLDDSELHTRIPWDEFDEENNDWAKSEGDMGEKKVDSVFSTEFFNSLYFPSDASDGFSMNFGEDCPLRITANKSGGVVLVYILTPRIGGSNNSRIMSVPDRVTEQYN